MWVGPDNVHGVVCGLTFICFQWCRRKLSANYLGKARGKIICTAVNFVWMPWASQGSPSSGTTDAKIQFEFVAHTHTRCMDHTERVTTWQPCTET